MSLKLKYKTANFGIPFQRSILAVYLQDTTALKRYRSVVDPRFFERPADQEICQALLTVFDKSRATPTRSSLEHVLKKQVRDKALLEDALDKAKSYYRTDTKDREYVLEQAIEFAKIQALANASLTTVHDIAKPGTRERARQQIIPRFQEAMRIGEDMSDMGRNYRKLLRRRIKRRRQGKMSRKPIPTGMRHLDYLLRGGCQKGWVVMVVGPAKRGKSLCLLNLAVGATAAGYRVLYATFELRSNDNEDDIGDRLDKRIVGPSKVELAYTDPDEFGRILKSKAPLYTQGDFISKEYPAKTVTCSKLKSLLEAWAAAGEPIDALVVDHADLMVAEDVSRTASRTEKEGQVYAELVRLAQEMDVLIYTASQAGKSALQKDTAGAEDAAWAYEKFAHVDLGFTLNQTREEARDHIMRLTLVSGRRQPQDVHIVLKVEKAAYYMKSIELQDMFMDQIVTPYDKDAESGGKNFAKRMKRDIDKTHEKKKKAA